MSTLATHLAAASGLARPGISMGHAMRLPLQSRSLDAACGGLCLLADLGTSDVRIADRFDADVTAGPGGADGPFAAVSLVSTKPFALVRNPGYCAREAGEPPVSGANVAGCSEPPVGDAWWLRTAVKGLVEQLDRVDGNAIGVFCLIRTCDVADIVCSAASMPATDAISAYPLILKVAAELKVLNRWTYETTVDASGRWWQDEDFHWSMLGQVSS